MNDLLGLLRVSIVIFLIFSGGFVAGVMAMLYAFVLDDRLLGISAIIVILIVDAILFIVFLAAGSILKQVKKSGNKKSMSNM